MNDSHLRVRFAPAPTGFMHLGNIRTALMNWLLAQRKNGCFIVRVEDTDRERNFDPGGKHIIHDLAWLDLTYQEGPGVGGPYAPYLQSERNEFYQKSLEELINKKVVYHCFCSSDLLEKKRKRQQMLKQPPRYDRTCIKLTQEQSYDRAQREPYIWRVHLNHEKQITIDDIAHGPITFVLKNFSDFPITRQNGSFTFMFANFVDDMIMKISCVIRGEDHLSNSAGQAMLYEVFGVPQPSFWHMPILCNSSGKKLSKRDFGFSLKDLKEVGYLPEAIINYLAIIGGSFEQEIMSIQELAQTINFDHLSSTSQITYDAEKLRWVNHKWICRLDIRDLTQRCRPFLEKAFKQAKKINDEKLQKLIQLAQKELFTLHDIATVLAFYFKKPSYTPKEIEKIIPINQQKTVLIVFKEIITAPSVEKLKYAAIQKKIPMKLVFSSVRYALTGSPHGHGIQELFESISHNEICDRLKSFSTFLQSPI